MTDSIDLAAFFSEPDVDVETYNRYADAAHASHQTLERFGVITNEQAAQAPPLRVALAQLVLNRFTDALTHFEHADDGQLRDYYMGECALALNRFDTALEAFKRAASAGWDALEANMRCAAVHVRTGALDEAEKLIEQHADAGRGRAAWHYAKGLLLEARDERVAAAEQFQQAVDQDPDHAEAMFHAARLYDMYGDDEAALRLYDRLTQYPRAHVNALLNAAVVYEDIGKYDSAMSCLRRVLKVYPNHRRARLFLKSVESCKQMVVEETGEEPVDARARLLATPLSEFELSVRARNCLKKMNIRTLGELMRLTEAELLAYKNFGETSLNEIKTLLLKKGLRLGQQPDEVDLETVEPVDEQKQSVPPGQEALLSKPVTDLELSVRSRRCLQRLNVQTLSDLLQYSEADLLATRNFGVTSLNEIKARLAEHGLQLSAKTNA